MVPAKFLQQLLEIERPSCSCKITLKEFFHLLTFLAQTALSVNNLSPCLFLANVLYSFSLVWVCIRTPSGSRSNCRIKSKRSRKRKKDCWTVWSKPSDRSCCGRRRRSSSRRRGLPLTPTLDRVKLRWVSSKKDGRTDHCKYISQSLRFTKKYVLIG